MRAQQGACFGCKFGASGLLHDALIAGGQKARLFFSGGEPEGACVLVKRFALMANVKNNIVLLFAALLSRLCKFVAHIFGRWHYFGSDV